MFCLHADLQMMKYQRWFKKMVPVWLKVEIGDCKQNTDKAVGCDKVHKYQTKEMYLQLDCLIDVKTIY